MINYNDLILIGHFAVDSGQAMVGDPAYLDEWDTNKNDEWNIEGKSGDYSFHGASATTIVDSYGVLGHGRAVVFSTGRGDGLYPVYVVMQDERISQVVIDFFGDVDNDGDDEEDDQDED